MARAHGEVPISALASALQAAGLALREAGVPFALIGGLAVSARTEPRFTRDVDLAVALAAQDIDALGHRMIARGFTIDAILTSATTDEVATLRLRIGEVRVDLLFAVTGLEAEACASAQLLEVFPGVRVPVVSLPYLVVFKLVAIAHRKRRQDEADVEALMRNATDAELRDTTALLDRIDGLHRTDVSQVRAMWQQFLGGH